MKPIQWTGATRINGWSQDPVLKSLFFTVSVSLAAALYGIFRRSRKTTLELERAQDTYRRLARATNDAVWDWDFVANRIWWNEGVHKLFGYPVETIPPDSAWWFDHIHPDGVARVKKTIEKVLRNQESVWGCDYRFRRVDGSYAHVIDRGYIEYSPSGKPLHMMGAMLDVTELRGVEQALIKSIRQRDELVGVVSHELKNPLTAISNSILLILRSLPKDEQSKSIEKSIERIQRAVQRMSRLTGDLLDITKLESGRFAIEPDRVSVLSVVNEVAQFQVLAAKEKEIHLTTNVPGDIPDAYCDHDRLIQVLSNLIGNAIKFTPKGGQVVVEATQLNDEILFHVRDTGIGIPIEDLPHVFDRFWQSKESAYRGTGLGLAVAKGIVESHGGKIWVESESGKGSSFHFTLKTFDLRGERGMDSIAS